MLVLNQNPQEAQPQRKGHVQRDLKRVHQRKDPKRDPRRDLRRHQRKAVALLRKKDQDLNPLHQKPKDQRKDLDHQAEAHSLKVVLREDINKKQLFTNFNTENFQLTW